MSASIVLAQQYPVIFNSPSPVRQLGIAVSFATHVTPLENKCYYYGDGGYTISISDEFLSRFRPRGFSIQAVCLGLVSQTAYDPESGRRLPTYIIADQSIISSNMRQYGKVIEPGAATEQLPLDLPNCFKNANPYTDCAFRFGRKTGKTLPAAETETYRQLGMSFDRAVRALESPPTTERFLGQDRGELVRGFRETTGYSLESDLRNSVDEGLLRYSSASIYVRLSSFPRGYGYGLDADGGAAPEVSAAALKAVLDGSSTPQIDVEQLRQIMNSRR
jgi:hypothetical protein